MGRVEVEGEEEDEEEEISQRACLPGLVCMDSPSEPPLCRSTARFEPMTASTGRTQGEISFSFSFINIFAFD